MYKLSAILFLSSVVYNEASLRASSSSSIHDSSASDSAEHQSQKQQRRKLAINEVTGECTVANFANAVGGTSKLGTILGTSNASQMQSILDTKCANALKGDIDLVDSIDQGPQFLKNFFDGGTTWNDNYQENQRSYNLSEDASVINETYNSVAKTSVFSTPDGGTSSFYPNYFSNFFRGDQECPLGVMACCYTSARIPSKPFSGNADFCAMNLEPASESNHIHAKSMTYFDTSTNNQAYCSGFAYEEGSFDDAVKYNTLFHMAMKENLYTKGLVKNIPGAPMCGCIDQMPIIDNADCTKAVEGYTINTNNGNVGVSMGWTSCGTNLKSYYNSLKNRSEMDRIFVNKQLVTKGTCDAAARSFMNDHMLVPN